jgi:acyl carrier protein
MAEKIAWEAFAGSVADFLGVEPGELKRETDIYKDLGLDSLGMFSLGMTLIKQYSVSLPLAVVSTINTVGDMYDEMTKRLSN